jgi:cysteinyl-tRNA synthetase
MSVIRTPLVSTIATLLIALSLARVNISNSYNTCSQTLGGVPIRSWIYQLQGVEPAQIAASSADLAVIDYSRDGTAENALTPEEITQMRLKPDGSRRLVLAYMSIGEAESYRAYWQKSWRSDPPSWLGEENARWKENYNVRYWEEDWQRNIVGAENTYLNKIIRAGFDGVYLDRVDAFQYWREHQEAEADMVQFVGRIASFARQQKPDFVVIAQNGEELLQRQSFRRSIDAIAKEDLFYGIGGDEVINDPKLIEVTLGYLQHAKDEHYPVLVIEYLSSQHNQRAAAEKFGQHGLIGTFGRRPLERFIENPWAPLC